MRVELTLVLVRVCSPALPLNSGSKARVSDLSDNIPAVARCSSASHVPQQLDDLSFSHDWNVENLPRPAS